MVMVWESIIKYAKTWFFFLCMCVCFMTWVPMIICCFHPLNFDLENNLLFSLLLSIAWYKFDDKIVHNNLFCFVCLFFFFFFFFCILFNLISLIFIQFIWLWFENQSLNMLRHDFFFFFLGVMTWIQWWNVTFILAILI